MQTRDTLENYQFVTSNGIIVPDIENIREGIVNRFIEIFGNIDTTEETAIGRLIDTFVATRIGTIEVNAQNANQMNLNQAVGTFLDGLGSLFGIVRKDNESDNKLRNRIKESRFIGTGFIGSIRRSVLALDFITDCIVLENNTGSTRVVPSAQAGIAVPPHSIFVGVSFKEGMDTNENRVLVGKAIYDSKSIGCGYASADGIAGNSEHCKIEITDEETEQKFEVHFYILENYSVDINVTVNTEGYTGIDSSEIIRSAIDDFFASLKVGKRVTTSSMISYLSKALPTITIIDISTTNPLPSAFIGRKYVLGNIYIQDESEEA